MTPTEHITYLQPIFIVPSILLTSFHEILALAALRKRKKPKCQREKNNMFKKKNIMVEKKKTFDSEHVTSCHFHVFTRIV